MNIKQIRKATWINLEKGLEELERDVSSLALVIRERKAEEAGEIIPEVMREAVETYTRLGVLGALDILEASK